MNSKLLNIGQMLLLIGCLFFTRKTQAQVAFDWVRQLGCRPGGSVNSMATTTDALGNVYVTGNFSNTLDVDSTRSGSNKYNLVAQGSSSDIYVVKLSGIGEIIWARSFGGPGYDIGMAITVDSLSNVYFTGGYSGKADFNPSYALQDTFFLTAQGSSDIFVCKLDSAGGLTWAKSMGGTSGDQGNGIAVDHNLNVWTVGQFLGTADFDPGAQQKTFAAKGNPSMIPAPNDAFISKLDINGNYLWAGSISGNGNIRALSAGLDRSGNVYLAGEFGDTADFNPNTSALYNLASTGNGDAFLCKLSDVGDFMWAKKWGGTQRDGANSISLSKGNVFVTGSFTSGAAFNPDSPAVYSYGMGIFNDIYISRFDTSGKFRWVKIISGQGINTGMGIATDGNSSVYATGYFQQSVDLNPGIQPADTFFVQTNGFNDVYIVKLDSSGVFDWGKSFGGGSFDYGYSIALDPGGSVYTTGTFQGDVDFDPDAGQHNLASLGTASNIFLHKLSCNSASADSISISTCAPYFEYNNTRYTRSGIYEMKFVNAAGCDSTLILDIAIHPVDPVTINVNGFVLGTVLPYESYQWLKNEQIVRGATQRYLTVSENAAYRVIVTNEENCADTSDNYRVSNVPDETGIADPSILAGKIKIYPNPTQGRVYIESQIGLKAMLTGIDGRVISLLNVQQSIDISEYAKGVYLLILSDKADRVVRIEKITKM